MDVMMLFENNRHSQCPLISKIILKDFIFELKSERAEHFLDFKFLLFFNGCCLEMF